MKIIIEIGTIKHLKGILSYLFELDKSGVKWMLEKYKKAYNIFMSVQHECTLKKSPLI